MKAILPRASALSRGRHELLNNVVLPVATTTQSRRSFSVLNRPPPNYPGHIPLTHVERAGLAIGSGIMSFMDPYRGGTFTENNTLLQSIRLSPPLPRTQPD